jgi:hypothetical protein
MPSMSSRSGGFARESMTMRVRVRGTEYEAIDREDTVVVHMTHACLVVFPEKGWNHLKVITQSRMSQI